MHASLCHMTSMGTGGDKWVGGTGGWDKLVDRWTGGTRGQGGQGETGGGIGGTGGGTGGTGGGTGGRTGVR